MARREKAKYDRLWANCQSSWNPLLFPSYFHDMIVELMHNCITKLGLVDDTFNKSREN